MYLENSNQAEVHKEIEFQINKCSNDNLPEGVEKCATPLEIDAYVKRIKVGTWSNFYEVDMGIHSDQVPVKKIEQWSGDQLLDPHRQLN